MHAYPQQCTCMPYILNTRVWWSPVCLPWVTVELLAPPAIFFRFLMARLPSVLPLLVSFFATARLSAWLRPEIAPDQHAVKPAVYNGGLTAKSAEHTLDASNDVFASINGEKKKSPLVYEKCPVCSEYGVKLGCGLYLASVIQVWWVLCLVSGLARRYQL